jgi:hypothetical protein
MASSLGILVYDHHYLNQEVKETLTRTLDHLSRRVSPALRILRSSMKSMIDPGELESLSTLDLVSTESFQRKVYRFSSQMAYILDEQILTTRQRIYPYAIRFPKPLRFSSSRNNREELPKPSLPIGDLASSKALWRSLEGSDGHLRDSSTVTISIRPETIYHKKTGSSLGRLPCNLGAPVIDTLGLVVLTNQRASGPHETLDTHQYIYPWVASKNQLFTSPGGNFFFQLLNSAYTHTDLSVFKIRSREQIFQELLPSFYSSYVGRKPDQFQGISPFGQFTFERDRFREAIQGSLSQAGDTAEELLLVGYVRGRPFRKPRGIYSRVLSRWKLGLWKGIKR